MKSWKNPLLMITGRGISNIKKYLELTDQDYGLMVSNTGIDRHDSIRFSWLFYDLC
jgi:hypothetical protein